MTCVVGLVHKGTIWMGGDSAATSDSDMTDEFYKKVFVRDDIIFGYTSSFRMGQLLEYKFPIPPHAPSIPVHKYMVTDFVDAVRDCLKSGGFAKKDSEVETGGQFLVGYQGRLFNIFPDYQVSERRDGYDAVGCGADYALGSLYSTPSDTPQRRIKLSLMAAEHFNGAVRGPFSVLSLRTTIEEAQKKNS